MFSGIGSLTASALVATIGDAKQFQNNRHWQPGWGWGLGCVLKVMKL
ncbi:transposase [Aeromonas hydrophila]|nr:transposase [Aeromonas hydrophila]